MLPFMRMSASDAFVSLVNLPRASCIHLFALWAVCAIVCAHIVESCGVGDREEHRPIHEAIIAISSFKFFHWVVTAKTILLRGLNPGRFYNNYYFVSI